MFLKLLKIKPIMFIFLLVSSVFHGQTRLMDSLNLKLSKTKSDTGKIAVLLQLANACDVSENLRYANPIIDLTEKLLLQTNDSSYIEKLLKDRYKAVNIITYYYITTEGRHSQNIIQTYNNHISICKKHNNSNGIIDAVYSIANTYNSTGEPVKRLNTLKEGYKLMQQLKNKKGEAKFIMQLAFFYAQFGDTTQALNYIKKGEKLELQIADSTRIAKGYLLRGNFFANIHRYDLALLNLKIAEQKFKLQKDTIQLLETYFDIGDVYKNKKDIANALKYYNLFNVSADIIKYDIKMNKFAGSNGIAEVYIMQKKYNEATNLHIKAYEFYKKIGHPFSISYGAALLANDYYLANNYKNALPFATEALDIAYQMQITDQILTAENITYKIDSASGNYRDAFIHYQKYLAIKGKLNEELVHKNSIQEKFQNELEEQNKLNQTEQTRRDLIAENAKKKQLYIIYGVIAILFIVIVFSTLLYKRFQLTNKQKQIIESQKHLVEEKHREITDSINYAERIQRSFLATKALLDANLTDYFVFFKPKDVVSGDFYWADNLDNGDFILATADSTGHGVPGAIMSLLNITSLEKASSHYTNPADILNDTRQTIINRLKKDGSLEGGKDGMDCSLIRFDFANNKLQIAVANNPVWIIREHQLIEIKPDKMPVGKSDRQNELFTLHTVDLKTGDTIYTLTDGFPDQFGGANGKKFMSKKLKEFLISIVHLPIPQQKELLETAFKNWIGDLEQVDDVCIIGIKI